MPKNGASVYKGIWLRLFTLNFSLIVNLFSLFPTFFNGLHTFLYV